MTWPRQLDQTLELGPGGALSSGGGMSGIRSEQSESRAGWYLALIERKARAKGLAVGPLQGILEGVV